jgi:hypothetical protein
VNRRILSGDNPHVKLSRTKGGEITWSLPYVGDEETVNNPFFDGLPQIHIAQLLQFVDSCCQRLDAFTHILQRYVKTPLDRHAVVACLIAYGTNVGLGKMGAISDMSYQALFTAANSFLTCFCEILLRRGSSTDWPAPLATSWKSWDDKNHGTMQG